MPYNKHSSPALFSRLYNEHIVKYRNKLVLASILMVIVAATTALHAWMIKPILDDIFFKQNKQMLALIPLVLIILSLIKAICSYFQNYLMKFVGQRIVTDVQIRLYQHLIKSDLDYINKSSSGRLISRFTNDISLLRNSMTNFLVGISKELLTVIFLLAVMIYESTMLAIVIFVVFPITIYPIVKMGKKMRKISTSTQEELGHYTAKLDETFQTMRIVKAYQMESRVIAKAKLMLEHIFNFYTKAIRIESLSSPVIETISGLSIAFVIWYGGTLLISGQTSPGSLFAFITAFITAYKPFKAIADLNNNMQEGLAAAIRLFTVLDYKVRITDSENAQDLIPIKNAVTVNDVSFAYNKTVQNIKKVSLKINPGEVTAFVGKSGSGKSTILNLILRFYDPDSGLINIGHQNIKDIKLKTLRQNIAYVAQEVMLYDDTIAANIASLNDTKIYMQEIIRAAKVADCHDFIQSLPDGYQTKLGQKGYKISGGQKQKISIARAIFKNAPILILDEATSSLDNIAEQRILANLTSVRKQQTTIVVAHRLSTIIDADKIYVFKSGQIAEHGRHATLLKNKGEYFKLYQSSSANDT